MGTGHTTEADRLRIRTLHLDASFSYADIEGRTEYTISQIRTAVKSSTIAKRSGRPPSLSQEQKTELVEFISASQRNRRLTFAQLAEILFNGEFGTYAIRYTLRRMGYSRYVAYRKPPISEKNAQLRLQFAREHLDWTIEQWNTILWSDETWVTGGRHRKTYVTRKKGEELNPTCIVERLQRKGGWMFWGCFAGNRKGPGIFWEKDWGKINADSYQEHIVPVVDGWVQMEEQHGIRLTFMQDNAPGHAAASTVGDLFDRGIRVVKWPPYSPDLNPIETVWLRMKDWLEDKYGDINKPSYDQLRRWVKEAWDTAITPEFLQGLVAEMPERMAAVIVANGMYTKY